ENGGIKEAASGYERMLQLCPRYAPARNNVGHLHSRPGQYQKAVDEYRKAIQREPARAYHYGNLSATYLSLDLIQPAQRILSEATAKQLTSDNMLQVDYQIAFLKDDAPGMQKALSTAQGNPDLEPLLVQLQANTDCYYGRYKSCRDLTRRAVRIL